MPPKTWSDDAPRLDEEVVLYSRTMKFGTAGLGFSLLATIGLVAVAAGPASADSSLGDSTVKVDSQHAAIFAEQEGITVAEATARLIEQDAFQELVGDLHSTYGEGHVDAWIDSSPTDQTLNIRTDVPQMANLAARRSGGLQVEYSAPTSEAPMLAERTSLVDQNIDQLRGAVPGLDGVKVDIESGDIVLSVPDSAARSARTAISASVEGLEGIPVRMESTGAGAGDHNRGGLSTTSCTTAFGASSGTYQGFFTAAHCAGTQNWYPAGSSVSQTALLRTTRWDAYADIQARSVAVTAIPDVWTGASYMTVTGTATSVVGANICKRGKVSGWSCGNVLSTTYKPTYSGACNGATCASVFVEAIGPTSNGDSGGPWISQGKAYGVHKGGSGSKSIYSRIQYMPAGWAIKVG
jgi:streptogrisin C